MNKSDIAALRHPTSTEPDVFSFWGNPSYAVVVSLEDAAENLRIARERFIQRQLEQSHLL